MPACSIYAVKDVRQGTDEDLEYTFAVAEALGANHVTLELPGGAERRGHAQAPRRLGREEEDLRRLPHASAGQHDGVR